MDVTLTGHTSLGQSGPASYGNEGVHLIAANPVSNTWRVSDELDI